jgi:hypothetical protein
MGANPSETHHFRDENGIKKNLTWIENMHTLLFNAANICLVKLETISFVLFNYGLDTKLPLRESTVFKTLC